MRSTQIVDTSPNDDIHGRGIDVRQDEVVVRAGLPTAVSGQTLPAEVVAVAVRMGGEEDLVVLEAQGVDERGG